MENYSHTQVFLKQPHALKDMKPFSYTHILRQWGHLARWLVVWNWRKDRIKVSKPHKGDSSLINKCLTYHKDLIAVAASDSKLGSLQSRYCHCRRNCRGRCKIDYPFAGKRKKNYDFIYSKQLTFRWNKTSLKKMAKSVKNYKPWTNYVTQWNSGKATIAHLVFSSIYWYLRYFHFKRVFIVCLAFFCYYNVQGIRG